MKLLQALNHLESNPTAQVFSVGYVVFEKDGVMTHYTQYSTINKFDFICLLERNEFDTIEAYIDLDGDLILGQKLNNSGFFSEVMPR